MKSTSFSLYTLAVAAAIALSSSLATAPRAIAQEPSPVAPFLKLLASGRVPAERQPLILENICKRGTADDLAVVLERILTDETTTDDLKQSVLGWLTDAATTRKVKPSGDLAGIAKLITASKSAKLQLAAVKLAGEWQVAGIGDALAQLAQSETASPQLQEAAMQGLAAMGDDSSKQLLEKLAASSQSIRVRTLAAAALVKSNLDVAAKLGAATLAASSVTDDPAPMIEAILNRQGGSDKLAEALAGEKLQADVAKMALRFMYSIGRSDEALSAILSKAAGVALDTPPPTAEEVEKLVAEVNEKGDAARGEKVFRRADVSCMKCHAINRAGGQIGPELSALGGISPVDYIVNSILNPDLAKKEQYLTRIVLTVDGETFTGIVVDEDDVKMNLKDASGKIITIAIDDIEAQKEGKSLMPQGLTKFLTHDELLDLIKYVSVLGKPGEYALRTVPAIQKWKVLKAPSAELAGDVPNVEIVREHILDLPAEAWQAIYGTTSGALPLDEVKPIVQGSPVVILQGEVNVITGGEVTLQTTSSEPAQIWIDAEPFEASGPITTLLSQGMHKITVRTKIGDSPSPSLKVELAKPEGSEAQFDVVGGN